MCHREMMAMTRKIRMEDVPVHNLYAYIPLR